MKSPNHTDRVTLARRLFDDLIDAKKSDEEVGKHLLAFRLFAELEARGLDPKIALNEVPASIFESWVLKIREQEAGDVDHIALEKALVRAALGDFAAAGSIIRAWIERSVVNAAALNEAVTGRRRQAKRARKPRPKKKPTHKSVVTEAMAVVRNQMTLDTFLEAAEVGSIQGLKITRHLAKGVERWLVECDNVDLDKPPVARSTLEGWWTASNSGQP